MCKQGSWMVAVVAVGKFAAVYAISQIQAQSPENKLIQLLGNCLKVVISCVDRFVRFLGHLAYIETAIYGTHVIPISALRHCLFSSGFQWQSHPPWLA